jgi:hypothetical protein
MSALCSISFATGVPAPCRTLRGGGAVKGDVAGDDGPGDGPARPGQLERTRER